MNSSLLVKLSIERIQVNIKKCRDLQALRAWLNKNKILNSIMIIIYWIIMPTMLNLLMINKNKEADERLKVNRMMWSSHKNV